MKALTILAGIVVVAWIVLLSVAGIITDAEAQALDAEDDDGHPWPENNDKGA